MYPYTALTGAIAVPFELPARQPIVHLRASLIRSLDPAQAALARIRRSVAASRDGANGRPGGVADAWTARTSPKTRTSRSPVVGLASTGARA